MDNLIRQKKILKVLLKGLKKLTKPDLLVLQELIKAASKFNNRIESLRNFLPFQESNQDLLMQANQAIKQSLIAIDKELKSRL